MDSIIIWDALHELKQGKIAPNSQIFQICLSTFWSLYSTPSKLHHFSPGDQKLQGKSLNFAIPISQIASNANLALILSASGQVFAYGRDEFNSGLFGSNLSSSTEPVKIETLSNTCIKQLAIGKTHAAAINQEGQLYTWGSGSLGQLGDSSLESSLPAYVKNADFLKCSQVACGNSFTAVCTEAGFMYIFSQKEPCNNCTKNYAYPCTLNEHQNQFTVKIHSFNDNLAVLNDVGECSIVGKCFCVYKLEADQFISDVAGCESGLIGLNSMRNTIYKWRIVGNEWTGESYSVTKGEVERIVGSDGKNVAIAGKGLTVGMMDKIKGKVSQIGAHRKNSDVERLSFEDILVSCGYRGKSVEKGRGELAVVLEKVVVNRIRRAFKYLWMEVVMSKVRDATNKGLRLVLCLMLKMAARKKLSEVRYFFVIWKTLKDSKKKSVKVLDPRIAKVSMKLIIYSLSKGLKRTLSEVFIALKQIPKRGIVKGLISISSIIKGLESKKFAFSLSKSFKRLSSYVYNKSAPCSPNLVIDPKYKISIAAPIEFPEPMILSPAPTLNKSFFSDTDYLSSNKLSNSCNVFNGSASPLCDPLSPFSEKSGLGKNLRSLVMEQISEKKKAKPGIERKNTAKITCVTTKGNLQNKSKNFAKEPSTPPIIMKSQLAKRRFTENLTGSLNLALNRSPELNWRNLIFSCAKRSLQEVFFEIVRVKYPKPNLIYFASSPSMKNTLLIRSK